MRSKRLLARLSALTVLAAVLPLNGTSTAVAAPLPAAPSTTATMNGEGDYIGGNTTRQWYPGNGTVRFSGQNGFAGFSVDGGDAGTYFSIELVAPDGVPFVAGTYKRAQRYPFQSAGRPGLSVSGDGRGCNQVAGEFTVLDVAYSGSTITRFWATYEHHCEGPSAPALTGEVRYQLPEPDAALLVVPRAVAWPDRYPGVPARPVPVTLVNTSSLPVSYDVPEISGPGAGSFTVVSSTCGETVPAGGRCNLYPRFIPTSAGSHDAVLTVRERGSVNSQQVQLHGDGIPGLTRWRMQGDAGEYISAGQAYDYEPRNARIFAGGGEGGVGMSLEADDGSWFRADFSPGTNDLLLPGRTYENAQRASFSSGSPGLDVSGSGRGCNALRGRFTIHELAREFGELVRFSATFEQYCDGSAVPLRGSLAYRAQQDQPVPTGPVATSTPTPTASATPSASPTGEPTATASPSPSPLPTSEPTPTRTPTTEPTPTAEPTSEPTSEPTPTAEPVEVSRPPGTVRLAGPDRYSTAAAVSRDSFPGRVEDVVLVTGADWVDALAAGPAAASLDGPVLPVRPDGVPDAVRMELTRLAPRRAWIIGGPKAVGPAVVAELQRAGVSVQRVAGPDRYSTAAAVADRFFPQATGAYYASGTGYADALAGGAAAAQRRWPLLLTARDTLPAATPVLGGERIVLGGAAAISEQVRSRLAARRVAGTDRFGTAAAVAADAFDKSAVAFIATGLNFPDALAGAAAAAQDRAPLLLVATDCAPTATREVAHQLQVTSRVVLGGQAVVSDRAATLQPC